MIWYDLIDDLKTFLLALPSLAGVSVYAGRPAALKEYPTILLLRDRDLDMSAYTVGLVGGPKGVVELFVETWVREDDADPETGYSALAAIEDKVVAGIQSWALSVGSRLGADIEIEIPEIIGDADSYRPDLGSRLQLRVEWSKFGR